MADKADQNHKCPYARITMALEILIVLVLLYLLVYVYHDERMDDPNYSYTGKGLSNAAIYTSGATMRRLGQVFSSTNQGQPSTIYNAEIPPGKGNSGVPVMMYPRNSVPPVLLNALAGK
jgi:hypothetical protein